MRQVPSKVVRSAPTRAFAAPGKKAVRKKDQKVFEVVRHDHHGLKARDLETNRETLFDASYFNL